MGEGETRGSTAYPEAAAEALEEVLKPLGTHSGFSEVTDHLQP